MTATKPRRRRSKGPLTGPSALDMQHAIARHIRYSLGKRWDDAEPADLNRALSLAVMDYLTDLMVETEGRYARAGAKRLHYLSMEFLMGRALGNNLLNLRLLDRAAEALARAGSSLEELRSLEVDAALGNGGLGRLAACFLDSLATLDLPGFGYGINYRYGLFRQEIREGYQVEKPDDWLAGGTPWQLTRSGQAVAVPLYGRVEHRREEGRHRAVWRDTVTVLGIPADMPVVGYGGRTVNYLRLYTAQASTDFDMQIFNEGDYLRAVEQKMTSETISKVLYPSDAVAAGRELRLVQEYFLVACAVRDILRRFLAAGNDPLRLPEKAAIQLNDTHPALAVAEVMRLLVDEQELPWEKAWEATRATLAYTNHTLLPEALECWSVDLLGKVLPRHLEIIYEINRRFLEEVRLRFPGETERLARMSLVEEGERKRVRMAHLAIVGSHSVNGVAALHTKLLTTRLVPDFHAMWPERFNNKTNGVTPRRWVAKANPDLADLLTETLGDRWLTEMEKLRGLEAHAGDPSFQERFMAVKRRNKEALAAKILERLDLVVDPDSLFDIQIKRIHEYKRQLLLVLHLIHLYLRCTEEGVLPARPRTFVIAGKAAPGYRAAKQIIKLIHDVARVVNRDPRVQDTLKVAFLPNYRVSLAERIIPAADLSEQISTAGMEASGTGNMKLAMNGAVTMGTLDGANVEIRQEVGPENIYIFGLTAAEVEERRARRGGDRAASYGESERVRRIMDALRGDRFCPGGEGRHRWVFTALVEREDPYFHLADLEPYLERQEEAARDFGRSPYWARKAILNTARTGRFSSDRTVREYAEQVWGLEPV